jgi:hypothetical protein
LEYGSSLGVQTTVQRPSDAFLIRLNCRDFIVVS